MTTPELRYDLSSVPFPVTAGIPRRQLLKL